MAGRVFADEIADGVFGDNRRPQQMTKTWNLAGLLPKGRKIDLSVEADMLQYRRNVFAPKPLTFLTSMIFWHSGLP